MIFQELEYLAGQVWMYPVSPEPNTVQPNVGVLRAKDRTILVDCGNSPRHARRIMGELAASAFPPVDTIIYTHHHWDHVFGAQIFNNASIIAHEACTAHLEAAAARPWNAPALRDEILRSPHLQLRNNAIIEAVEEFRDFRICLPAVRFSKSLTLYTDQFRIEVVHIGGIHADDSVIVKIPEAGVMFLGDSYYPPVYFERTPENDKLDIAMLESFIEEGYTLYLDGHGRPRTLAQMQELVNEERGRQNTTL